MVLPKSNFNLMIAGRTNLGKSTFLDTLFSSNITQQSNDINMYILNIDVEGTTQQITAIDTPGFGNNIDDTVLLNSLAAFLKMQFDNFLTEETKIRRNKNFEDGRVHCLLYFIPPGCILKPSDIEILKRIHNLVNVIICIAKSESITQDERLKLRESIKDQIQQFDISIFDFNKNLKEDKLLKHPFFVVGSRNKKREYRWGTAMVEDPNVSDFQVLKEMLFYNTAVFINTTDSELYEAYRTKVLTDMLLKEKQKEPA